CDLVADANHVFHARDVTCEYGDISAGRAHRFDLCTRFLRRAASSGQHDLPHPLIDQSLRDGEAYTAETARDPDGTVVRRRTLGFEDDLADVPGLGHVAECRGRVRDGERPDRERPQLTVLEARCEIQEPRTHPLGLLHACLTEVQDVVAGAGPYFRHALRIPHVRLADLDEPAVSGKDVER